LYAEQVQDNVMLKRNVMEHIMLAPMIHLNHKEQIVEHAKNVMEQAHALKHRQMIQLAEQLIAMD
jgi:hypothetical protein